MKVGIRVADIPAQSREQEGQKIVRAETECEEGVTVNISEHTQGYRMKGSVSFNRVRAFGPEACQNI